MDPRAAILTNPAQANNLQPALQMPTPGGNARQSTRVPNIQPRLVDMRTEGNIRIGGAIMAGSSLGGNEAINAGIQEYAGIQDYNRRAEDDAFALGEARRESIQARMDAQNKLNSDKKQTNGADMIMAQESLNELTTLISALEDGGLTGPVDGTVQAWLDRSGMRDYFMGDDAGAKRAYYRQRLENYRVNEALAVTANTKGAISDKEMVLFLAPIPATADTTEATWLFHLREKLRINSKILAFEQGAASGGGDFSFVD